MARRPPGVTEATKRLARTPTGPVFSSELLCLGCGWEGDVSYTQPREMFRCPACYRLKAIRADEHDRRAPDYPGGTA